MPEDQASKKRRQRHFWGWVTGTKKLSKNEVSKNFKILNNLRSQHAELFPQYHEDSKSFLVKENIKEFHRKVLAFNETMRNNDGNFVYEDRMFKTLPLHDGDIVPTVFESFAKHYFAGYKSFVKHGGLSNHETYQMHYLDMLHNNYNRNRKKNQYAISKVKKEMEKKRLEKLKEQEIENKKKEAERKLREKEEIERIQERLRQEREAKKREEEFLAQQEKLERQRKKTELERINRLHKERLEQQKIDKKKERKRKAEETEKRKTLKKLKVFIEKEGLKKCTKEEEQLLSEDREERLSKQREDNDKKILDDMSIMQLPGIVRDERLVEPHDIGKLGDFKCKFCSALLWKREIKTLCCNMGQVPSVNPDKISEEEVLELYKGETALSKRFLENINGFNLMFSFTSITTSGKLDNEDEKRLCYKIQGRVYHHMGYLDPKRLQAPTEGRKDFWNNTDDCFLDIYFYYDKTSQVKFRSAKITKNISKHCKRRKNEELMYEMNEEIVKRFFNYFVHHNGCISGILKELECTKELIRQHTENTGGIPEVSINLKSATDVRTQGHKGVYHLPTTSSCVGAIVNLDSSNRHLQITIRSPKPDTKYPTRIVNHQNIFYDAFQYPMLIPNGNVGYSYTLQMNKMEGKQRIYSRLTPADYYSSLYMEREGIFNYVTKCRRLYQQFVVDNYVKVETMRLSFIEQNQSTIRKERTDILKCEDSTGKGQRIIIPPTYVGGPRYMKQRQQDALAYVTNYGSPDFFITFTMNPAWKELSETIKETGVPSSNTSDRPDLISRIFKQKVDSLIEDLTVNNIFGKVKSYLYSIEWQKRGLPHVHILLWMRHKVTAEFVGKIISAEIPDKEKEPRLFEIVTNCMIHGPCKGFDESQPCCQQSSPKTGKDCCGKGFPKPCRDQLLFGNNGYPLYKRRAIGNGGNSFNKKLKGKFVKVDNSWVVPYNPYLCLRYNAHINVECSNSIKAIAYVTKYVNKGCDRILFSKTDKDDGVVNEVKNYQDARYVNSNEATWKIFKFPIHKSFPPVTTLDLHLEGENEIFFRENENVMTLQRKIDKDTQLTAFFKLCKDNDFAARLHYQEIPNHFVFNKGNAKWTERKTRTTALGRIRAVTNKTVELFYLRVLLTHKKGPTSYECLRTVDGVVYETYREAVKAMGLLNDEDIWLKTIMEIISYTNDRNQLRSTYASMLVFSDLEDQRNIWEETKDLFASDYLFVRGLTEYNDEIYRDALDDIQEKVYNCGGGKIEEYGLPPSRHGKKVTNIIRREKSYNKSRLQEEVIEKLKVMNDQQRYCYDTIMERVENGHKYSSNGFFINAPGGTGKSFLLNALLDTARSTEKIALAVASSGIAATVLHGGRTAHNMFKIPIMKHNEIRSCNVKRNSEMAKLLEMTSLIVWDEAVMANKNTITALDITMRDILEVDCFMGGVVFVCAGDFRQILPVVRNGGDELACCVKSSYFWNTLTHLELSKNVRLKGEDILNRVFAKKLLDLGTTPHEEYIFPENFGVVVDNREQLIEKVYDDFEENFLNVSYFEKRAIISPTNDDVDCINDMVFEKLHTEEKMYRSEDISIDNEMDIQTSVYNSINSPSVPLHELKLKVGAVVMVMRNICPPKLCNGTRIIVTNLQKNIVVGNILTGAFKGQQVMIPRITLETTDTSVLFKRKQFPIRLCYAMTINKSQGQTFDKCGLLLDTAQCFAHGQLYVACSRVTSHDSLIIYTGFRKIGDLLERKPARNCVYKELFSGRNTEDNNALTENSQNTRAPKVYKPSTSSEAHIEEEPRVGEEEPDQSIVNLPRISEEEAITMIMPDEFYADDYTGEYSSAKKEV